MVDWRPYLESIRKDYAQWWRVYTFTDVVGRSFAEPETSEPKSPFLDLGLMAQTIVRQELEPEAAQDAETTAAADEAQQPKEKIERFTVLEGLRKYAPEHVLLVGRPGSGKSTSLLRLLIEEADVASQKNPDTGTLGIPVLVELRYFQTSIEALIRNFFKQHGRLLETATIEQLLFEGRLLLLIDGVNELPSEEARRQLRVFHQTYGKTPMVFTTRELGAGGNLGIEKKLEMQPLSEPQMRQFVNGYLPGQGEALLRQLKERLRSFGQTPLLLWMLCSLFRATGEVPQNLGLVFRQFTRSYEKQLRSDVPVSEESRRWWPELMKQLAYTMTEGDSLTEIKVAIEQSAAEACLAHFLDEKKCDRPWDRAKEYVQDLLNHHLVQSGAGETIEFRHQLIQEYYTAEWLLDRLKQVSDDELQSHYLNYLKWTEPLKVVSSLQSSKIQAERIIKKAIEADWQLGARLLSHMNHSWHKELIQKCFIMECSTAVKAWLLSLANPRLARSILIKENKNEESLDQFYYEKDVFHLYEKSDPRRGEVKVYLGQRRQGFYAENIDFFGEDEWSHENFLEDEISSSYSMSVREVDIRSLQVKNINITASDIRQNFGEDSNSYTLEPDYPSLFVKMDSLDEGNTERVLWLEKLLQDGSYTSGAWAI